MKYIKTYEELKYSKDDIKLISKLRYQLNKLFYNKCGVSKVRHIKVPAIYNRYNYGSEWVEYTGTTMLFHIGISSQENKLILDIFKKYADKIGLTKEYDFSESYQGTYQQMEELLKNIPHIKMEVDMVKYNI